MLGPTTVVPEKKAPLCPPMRSLASVSPRQKANIPGGERNRRDEPSPYRLAHVHRHGDGVGGSAQVSRPTDKNARRDRRRRQPDRVSQSIAELRRRCCHRPAGIAVSDQPGAEGGAAQRVGAVEELVEVRDAVVIRDRLRWSGWSDCRSSRSPNCPGSPSWSLSSISAAGALVTLPALFVTATVYWPWLAAPALVTMRLSSSRSGDGGAVEFPLIGDPVCVGDDHRESRDLARLDDLLDRLAYDLRRRRRPPPLEPPCFRWGRTSISAFVSPPCNVEGRSSMQTSCCKH